MLGTVLAMCRVVRDREPPSDPRNPVRVLLITSDTAYAAVLGKDLSSRGMIVSVPSAQSVDAPCTKKPHELDVVVAEIHGVDDAEWQTIETIRASCPLVEVVAISSAPEITHAVAAMRAGAYDVLGYPVTCDQLAEVVTRAGSRKRHGEARLRELDRGRHADRVEATLTPADDTDHWEV